MAQYKSKLLKSGRNKGKYRYTRTLYAGSAAGVPEKPLRKKKAKKAKKIPAASRALPIAARVAPKKVYTGKKRRLGSKGTKVLL
jgi:hypothetical protein